MKVFISYSTEDRKAAEALFDDVAAAGATVFQFGRTDTIGKPSWDQVIEWINQSDVFIVLLSKHALVSRPVREEIEQAHYSYINRERPSKLIPAIIESGTKPPVLIERFTQVDLVRYERGLARLLTQLGLERRATTPLLNLPKRGPLPDLSWVFQEYKEKNPAPTPANEWSKAAEKIVANYNVLKPDVLGEPERALHLDNILTRFAGKKPAKTTDSLARYDRIFLGLPSDEKTESASPLTPKISDFLLTWEPTKPGLPLSAPKLELATFILKWSAVLFAKEYLLEASASEDFASAKEVYRGAELQYTPLMGNYYRVKALGKGRRADSPWSNVVQDTTLSLLRARPKPRLPGLTGSPFALFGNGLTLPPPQLALNRFAGKILATWAKVDGATGYVLQRSPLAAFTAESTVVYDGASPMFTDTPGAPAFFQTRWYYRAKTKGGPLVGDSDWSNVVDVSAS